MQALIRLIERSPSELYSDFRSRYVDIAQDAPVLAVAAFACGVRLLVLIQGKTTRLDFVPEFNRVWWRAVYRWSRVFPGVSDVSVELSRLGRRRDVPFFAAATSTLERWKPVWNGVRVSLDDHVEFVIPADDDAQRRAHGFLSQWVAEFAESGAGDSQFPDAAVIEALCGIPQALDGAADQALMRRVSETMDRLESHARGRLRACERRIFPNLLEMMLPPALGAEQREAWKGVLDRRTRWVAGYPVPEDYPAIQSLASSSESEREFVGEADPGRMRGRLLVGGERMQLLLDAGLRLEHLYPVLGTDPFESWAP
jgi:hypothetical protein